ncbi:MAG: TonB-dependent receptor [Rhizobacter sp.]|nr:TonB-dependent receptor [Chlorobiales bacterium]
MKRIHFIVRILFVLIFTAFTAPFAATAQEQGTIEGSVIDRQTKQEIIGAKIQVITGRGDTALSQGALSDAQGNFRIENVPVGTHRLKITATDYKLFIKTDVAVSSAQSTKLSLELKSDIATASEVVVTADYLFAKSEDAKVSSNMLSREEIRRAPGSVEDVSRMVQSLPGVAVASDARNDLIVRGGAPSENFTMIDGIEIPNINHFGSQGAGGGPIGMINSDFIEDVTFSAGGFGARYGDRLSGVMDIRYREGDRNRIAGKFDLGLAGAGFVIEGPVQQGKSSFIVSARKSYLDLIVGATGLTAVPNYSNFNVKATYEISPEHRLSFIGLGGVDDIFIKGDQAEDETSNDRIRNNGWQGIAGLSHKWLAGKQTYIQTSLSGDVYRYFTDVNNAGVQTYINSSYEGEAVMRSDFSHRLSPSDELQGGVNARYIRNSNDVYIKSDTNEYGKTFGDINYSATAATYKLGGYVQYSKQFFGNRLGVTGGARVDYFEFLNNSTAVSPRLSASYALQSNLKVNAAWGLYHQAPPMVWLMADSRNRDLKYAETQHLVGGIEYYPFEDVKVTLEVFSKDTRDYAASLRDSSVSYANVGADFGASGLEHLTSGSTGYARGVEFFVQKKFTTRFYGQVNYSYSQIRFAGLDGVLRAGSYDYQNIFTVIAGYKITDAIEVSGKWRFVGGRPYTPYDVALSGAAGQGILDLSQVNGARFSDYHRLDVRADFRFNFAGLAVVSYIDLQNTYNRQNIERLSWNEKTNRPQELYQWSFLPAGGVKVEF